MKRLVLLAVPALISGCGVQVRATTPQPVFTAEVVTTPPPPPPGPASASVEVTVEPVQTGDPEEVTASTEPPDPVYEEQTDSPGATYVWVGGYWGWNGADWSWNWGRWEVAPEGRVYIEPYYERVGDRVVYVHGYWGARDAPRRAYGGEVIRFSKPERPANYHRGEHVVVEHRAGPPPGHRPGAAYVHASGSVRPVPRETVPHRTAVVEKVATPRGEARPEVKGEGKAEVRTEGRETRPEARVEGREAKPEARVEGREAKPEAKVEGREAKPEAKVEGREAKPEAKVEMKAEAKPGAKADTKTEPRHEAKTETHGEAKAETPREQERPENGSAAHREPVNAPTAKADKTPAKGAPANTHPAPKKNEKDKK